MNKMKNNEYLNERDVCVLLGISRSTLYRLREVEGLPFHRVGPKLIRYQVTALDEWLQKKMQVNRYVFDQNNQHTGGN